MPPAAMVTVTLVDGVPRQAPPRPVAAPHHADRQVALVHRHCDLTGAADVRGGHREGADAVVPREVDDQRRVREHLAASAMMSGPNPAVSGTQILLRPLVDAAGRGPWYGHVEVNVGRAEHARSAWRAIGRLFECRRAGWSPECSPTPLVPASVACGVWSVPGMGVVRPMETLFAGSVPALMMVAKTVAVLLTWTARLTGRIALAGDARHAVECGRRR